MDWTARSVGSGLFHFRPDGGFVDAEMYVSHRHRLGLSRMWLSEGHPRTPSWGNRRGLPCQRPPHSDDSSSCVDCLHGVEGQS